MEPSAALSSVKPPRQRGFIFGILLRPFTLGLLASFLGGAGLVGWLKPHTPPERPAIYTQALPITVPLAATPAPAPVAQVFDFRGAGRGVSDNPRALPPAAQVAAAALPAQPAETAEDAVVPAVEVPPAAVPMMQGHAHPQIAIVIDDIGPNYRDSIEALKLPAAITMAMLPYAEKLQQLVARARAGGHEMIVHLPMEPVDMAHNDPGPNPLTVSLTPEQISVRVEAALNSFEGYVGLNNHMGSRFTADVKSMQALMGELQKHDLIFFDSRTTPQSVGIELATQLNMKFISRDVFLDNETDPDLIAGQLSMLENLARVQGHATAIGHPHPATLAALKEWIPTAQARGVELVPLSALAQRLGTMASTPAATR